MAFALLVALRLMTLPPDAWEWDELLFTDAVRHGFDLTRNRPHPPGYPLFVECARAIVAVSGVDPVRALALAGTAGSLVAVAGGAYLLVALGVSFPFAVLGAFLYAFVPSVWLHGVRPLSDGPGAAAFFFATGMLVKSVRERSSWLFVGAAAVTALGFGLRPQAAVCALPLAAVAALALVRRREWKPLGLALFVGAALSVAIWMPAVTGTGGLKPFLGRIVEQARYAGRSDSLTWTDLGRSETWTRWFRDPFGPTALALLFGVLSAASLVASWRKAAPLVTVFLPLLVVTFLYSALQAAPRYAIVLLVLPCGLAAICLERVAAFPGARLPAVGAGVALIGWMAALGAPAVLEVARHESPPVAAMRILRDDPELKNRPLVIWGGLAVHKKEYIPARASRTMQDDRPMTVNPGELLVMSDDVLFGQTPIRRVAFQSELLLRISRGRFLNVSVTEAQPGVGIARPWHSGKGEYDWVTGNDTLREGDVFEVKAAHGPIDVEAFGVPITEKDVLLKVTSGDVTRDVVFPAGKRTPLAFQAALGKDLLLFALRPESGELLLSGWRLSAPTFSSPVAR